MQPVRTTRTIGLLALLALGLVACGQTPPEAPTIASFTATPASVEVGGTVELAWETRNATAVAVSGPENAAVAIGTEPAAAGTVSVTLDTVGTHTYSLLATGVEGTDPVEASVTVEATAPPAPVVDTFTLDPAEIPVGESSTLTWTVQEAVRVVVSDGTSDLVDSAEASGSLTVSPTEDTTYTLTATGRGDAQTVATAVLTVHPLPVIDVFEIQDLAGEPLLGEIVGGDSVVLVWETSFADSVSLVDADGNVLTADAVDGSLTVVPELSTTYTLTATGPGGVATADAQVSVLAIVQAFTVAGPGDEPATLATVRAGDLVTLAWATHGATGATLMGPQGPMTMDGLVSGSLQLAADVPGAYTLSLEPTGPFSTATVTLALTEAPRIRTVDASPNPTSVNVPIVVSFIQDGATAMTVTAVHPDGIEVVADDVDLTTGTATLTLDTPGDWVVTLEASNDLTPETHTRQLILDIRDEPTVELFSVRPGRTVSGSEVAVVWDTTEADTVTLLRDGLPVTEFPGGASGSFADLLVADTTYQLVVDNGVGQVTLSQEITATVGSPEILAFAADRDYFAPEADVTLSWENLGGRTLEVVEVASGQPVPGCSLNGIFEQIAAGGCTFPAPATLGPHAYELRIADGDQTTRRSLSIEVIDGPVIRSLTASTDLLTAGQALTFIAEVDPALDGTPPILTLTDQYGAEFDLLTWDEATHLAEGTDTFNSPREYVFTLVASSEETTPSKATVRVNVVPAPTVEEFVADDDFIETEGTLTSTHVRWLTRGATQVSLWVVGADEPFFATNTPEQAQEYAYEVSPDANTEYRLEATNAAGSVDTATLIVGVDYPVFDSLTITNAWGDGGAATDAEVDDRDATTTGDEAVISWSTRRADGVYIAPPVPFVTTTFDGLLATQGEVGLTNVVQHEMADYKARVTVALPFSMPFYGQTYDQVLISANGWASFNLSESYDQYNGSLPSTAGPDALVAVYHDNLEPVAGSTLWTAEGTDPDLGAYFLVQWRDYAYDSSLHQPSSYNFQVKMFASGDFEFTYGDLVDNGSSSSDYGWGDSATVGFQDENHARGYLYQYNEQTLVAGQRVYFDFPNLLPPTGSFTVSLSDPSQVFQVTAFSEIGESSGDVKLTTWRPLTPDSPDRYDLELPAQVGLPVKALWDITDATLVELRVDDTVVCSHQAQRINRHQCEWVPEVDGTHTIELRYSNPVSQASISQTVEVLGALSIDSFLADGATSVIVPAGQPVQLTWEVTNALELDLVEAVSGRDLGAICPDMRTTHTCTVTPPSSTRYDLYISDVAGYAEFDRVRYASVQVYVSDTRIDDFEVTVTGQTWMGAEVGVNWAANSSAPTARFTVSPRVSYRRDVPFVSIANDLDAYVVSRDSADPMQYLADTSNLGFSFPYDGRLVSTFGVSDNGWLGLGDDFSESTSGYSYSDFPDTGGPDGIIAPFWSWYASSTDASQVYKVAGRPGNRHLLVEWAPVRRTGYGTVQVQAALYDDGRFEFRYGEFTPEDPTSSSDLNWLHGDSVSIGWENFEGTEGHRILYDEVRPDLLVPGRAFTVFPAETTNSGSRTYFVEDDVEFEMCASGDGVTDCRSSSLVVVRPGDVIITELMIDPSPLADGDAEWVELRNTSARALDLQGWTLSNGIGHYALPSGNPILLAPGEHLVIAAGTSEVNGGVDTPYVWDDPSLTLDDQAGELVLQYGPLVVDRVAWDASWTIPSGASLTLDPSVHQDGESANDVFLSVLSGGDLDRYWCASRGADIYGADLQGSPGSLGRGCRYESYDLERLGFGGHHFIDIERTGYPLDIVVDDAYTAVPGGLGFTVDYYGRRVSTLWVSSNGWLTLDPVDPGDDEEYNYGLPDSASYTVHGTVAPFWDNLTPRFDPVLGWPLSGIHVQTFGTPGDRFTVVQWSHWNYDSTYTDMDLTFQVQIHENGDIVFAYGDLYHVTPPTSSSYTEYHRGDSATVGIESINDAFGIELGDGDPVLKPWDLYLFRRR